MTVFQEEPSHVATVQWFQDGDHPDVELLAAGRHGDGTCNICGQVLDVVHGKIADATGVLLVCPGNWVAIS